MFFQSSPSQVRFRSHLEKQLRDLPTFNTCLLSSGICRQTRCIARYSEVRGHLSWHIEVCINTSANLKVDLASRESLG